MVRVGDLVRFHSTFEPFNADYVKRSPGVVLDVKESMTGIMGSYVVLWRDGSVTSEREGYLQIVEDQ